MSLKIELAPYERIIIGNCDITNGPKRTEIYIAKGGALLRQKYILAKEDADTPCKKFYVAMQDLFLSVGEMEIDRARKIFTQRADDLSIAMPDSKNEIQKIVSLSLKDSSFEVVKLAQALLKSENYL